MEIVKERLVVQEANRGNLSLHALPAEIRPRCEELEHSGPVRWLMRNHRWLVPPDQRPKIAPPPSEERRLSYGLAVRLGTEAMRRRAARTAVEPPRAKTPGAASKIFCSRATKTFPCRFVLT